MSTGSWIFLLLDCFCSSPKAGKLLSRYLVVRCHRCVGIRMDQKENIKHPVAIHGSRMSECSLITYPYTVEPRFTDTPLIRTPRYYGQFRWSRRKPHTFSLKLTRLIRTPVNTDNGHFSVSRVTKCHTLSTPLYGHCVSCTVNFHCHYYLLIGPWSNNDRIWRVKTILLQREAQ